MATKKGANSKMTVAKKARHKKQLFETIDRNKNGKVSIQELKIAFSGLGANPTETDMEIAMKDLNIKPGEEISFEIFSACLESYFREAERKDKETERKLFEAAFDHFDIDKNGFFDKAELKNMLVKCGEKPTDKEIDRLFAAADETKDGKLDRHEVIRIFLKDMP